MVARYRRTWIVMADGSRARIVTKRVDAPGFDVIEELAAEEARTPSREIGSDRPGRVQESGYSGRHGIEPRHDPHQDAKSAFTQQVADELNRAAAENRFDVLILFAPPHVLGELRPALNDIARDKLKGEAAKDLTKLPIAELDAHLDALDREA